MSGGRGISPDPALSAVTLSAVDIADEVLADLSERPGRSLLTMAGTALGIGAFVSVLGLASTTANRIDEQFSLLNATQVTALDLGQINVDDTSIGLPRDAGQRLEGLPGVVHAGTTWSVKLSRGVSVQPVGAPSAAGSTTVSVAAASPAALLAFGPRLRTGRLFDPYHDTSAQPVAILGSAAADALGVTRLDGHPAVFLDGRGFAVIGVVDDLRRRPDLLSAVLIPTGTALQVFGPPREPRATMIVETRLGAAQVVAAAVPLALRPEAPELVGVSAPADPTTLRRAVTGDIDLLVVVLAVVSLLAGGFGIANTTLVSVLERTAEIGLRRALGAQRRHVYAQYLAEAAAHGGVGGLVGTCVGVGVVVAVAATHSWTPVMHPWFVLPGPLAGALIGALAGIYPARRAGRIEPVEALRC